MHGNIKVIFDRADEILVELEQEYRAALDKREVSARTKQLCHDVLEKLRSALDRTARRYWEEHISPSLSADDRASAAVYFPIAPDEHTFSSIMGRWRWKSVKGAHSELEGYLVSIQPYASQANNWLQVLNSLVNEGKHIDLSPQTRVENRRVTVSGPGGGSVSYGPGVIFGSGVQIMGVPVDPRTQRVVPNRILQEQITIWVDFTFSKHGSSALGFCKDSVKRTKSIVETMSSKFNLG